MIYKATKFDSISFCDQRTPGYAGLVNDPVATVIKKSGDIKAIPPPSYITDQELTHIINCLFTMITSNRIDIFEMMIADHLREIRGKGITIQTDYDWQGPIVENLSILTELRPLDGLELLVFVNNRFLFAIELNRFPSFHYRTSAGIKSLPSFLKPMLIVLNTLKRKWKRSIETPKYRNPLFQNRSGIKIDWTGRMIADDHLLREHLPNIILGHNTFLKIEQR
jgi:hypothetical protein